MRIKWRAVGTRPFIFAAWEQG